jgi:uncharacterized protein
LTDREKSEYRFFPNMNFIYPNHFSENNSNFFNKFSEHFNNQERSLNEVVSEDQVLRNLANVSSLLLEITDDCNLRCRYCVYSGKFHDRRNHGKKKMSWSTAKSAIEYFFNWMMEHKNLRTAPYFISIGFYGGEALLNFDLFHKAVDYSRYMYKKQIVPVGFKDTKIGFGLTTNGVLLDDEKIDYFVQNDFNLTISIDGPKEIHDRNKGKGNFGKLIAIIKTLKENFPGFYKDKVSFSIVYDKDTDLQEVRDFFSMPLFEDSRSLFFGYVTEHFSDIPYRMNGLNEKEVIYSIFEKIKKKKSLSKIENGIISHYLEFSLTHIGTKNSFGAYCTLGSKKIFARVNGDFLGCEKMSDSFKIGSIHNGFDIERIMEIEKEWREKTKDCVNCIIQGCCHACAGTVGKNNKLIFEEYCGQKRELFLTRFSDYTEYVLS